MTAISGEHPRSQTGSAGTIISHSRPFEKSMLGVMTGYSVAIGSVVSANSCTNRSSLPGPIELTVLLRFPSILQGRVRAAAQMRDPHKDNDRLNKDSEWSTEIAASLFSVIFTMGLLTVNAVAGIRRIPATRRIPVT